jgi:hypothetical protein
MNGHKNSVTPISMSFNGQTFVDVPRLLLRRQMSQVRILSGAPMILDT